MKITVGVVWQDKVFPLSLCVCSLKFCLCGALGSIHGDKYVKSAANHQGISLQPASVIYRGKLSLIKLLPARPSNLVVGLFCQLKTSSLKP